MSAGFRDISPEAYKRDELGTRPSLNNSILRVLLNESPRHARDMHPRLTTFPEYEWPETDAMKIGSVAHAMLLGAGARYTVLDPSQFQTKDGRPGKTLNTADAKAAKAEAESRGEIVIDAKTMRNAAMAVEHARAEIDIYYPRWYAGHSEHVILWHYRLNDQSTIICRAMMDRYVPECVCVESEDVHRHIFDPKFTGLSASDSWLDRTIAADGWDIQDAFYTLGERLHLSQAGGPLQYDDALFTFIVTETYPPYDTRFVTIPEQWRALARHRVDVGANIWGKCIDTGEWPGRARRHVAVMPAWMADAEIETGE